MRDIRVATVQFEHHDDDKPYNLSRIRELTRDAVERGPRSSAFTSARSPRTPSSSTSTGNNSLGWRSPFPTAPRCAP